MKKITLNNIEYTYQRKEIHIGDTIITDSLDNVYEASIHDADDIGNVVIEQKELKTEKQNVMENIKLPIPENGITKETTLEELYASLNLFKENADKIKSLEKKNYENYETFISQNRNSIKNMMPVKNKVYCVLEKGGWMRGGYEYERNEHLIKYVLVTFVALKKDVGYNDFIPSVKAIPLDENGKLIKYKEDWHFRNKVELQTLGERGDNEILITHLSKEDYPNILLEYKKHLSRKKSNEAATFLRLQKKVESGELKIND